MTASADFAVLTKVFLVSPSKIKCGRGGLVFKIWTKVSHEKIVQKYGGRGGGVLVEREGWFQIFHHFSLRKTCVHY